MGTYGIHSNYMEGGKESGTTATSRGRTAPSFCDSKWKAEERGEGGTESQSVFAMELLDPVQLSRWAGSSPDMGPWLLTGRCFSALAPAPALLYPAALDGPTPTENQALRSQSSTTNHSRAGHEPTAVAAALCQQNPSTPGAQQALHLLHETPFREPRIWSICHAMRRKPLRKTSRLPQRNNRPPSLGGAHLFPITQCHHLCTLKQILGKLCARRWENRYLPWYGVLRTSSLPGLEPGQSAESFTPRTAPYRNRDSHCSSSVASDAGNATPAMHSVRALSFVFCILWLTTK